MKAWNEKRYVVLLGDAWGTSFCPSKVFFHWMAMNG